MKALKEKLIQSLQKGSLRCIVTYIFSIPGLNPEKVILYKGSTKLYLYTATAVATVAVDALVEGWGYSYIYSYRYSCLHWYLDNKQKAV